jgi:hypothetical protein
MQRRGIREIQGTPQGGLSTPSIDFMRQQMSRGESLHPYPSTEKKRLDQQQEQFERVALRYGQQAPWEMLPERDGERTTPFPPDRRLGEEGVLTLGGREQQRTYRTMQQAREALDRRLEAGRLGTHKNIQARIDELRSRSPESDDNTDREYNRLPEWSPNPPHRPAPATSPGRDARESRTRENPLLRGLSNQLEATADWPSSSTGKGKSRAIDRPVASSSRHDAGTTASELRTTTRAPDQAGKKRVIAMTKFEKTRKPAVGSETDEEIDAANNNDRVSMLKHMQYYKRRQATKAKTDITRDDNNETKEALRRHAKALEDLQALRNSGFDNRQHQYHGRYQEALKEYRLSRKSLKDYGRWDRTFE